MKYVLPRSPRFISIFLVMFLVFLSIFPVIPSVQAAPNAIISIDNTSVVLGGTTVVTVKVQGLQAPGLAGYDFKINYNPAAVNLIGLDGTSDFSAPITHFTAPDQNPSNVPGEILVIAAQSSGKTGDIQLFNLTFKAVGTSSQNTPITLTVNDGGFSDADLSDIPYTINNGSIAIEGGSTPSLSVSPAMLTEASTNDGSLASGDITLTLANGTFATDIGKSDVGIAGLPAGMDYTVSRTSDTMLKVTVTGKALSHDNTNDTTLTLTVNHAKVSGALGDITGTIGLDFNSNGVNNLATLTSTIGTVSTGGSANETITEVPSGTTLAVFRAALTPATGATTQIYTTDGTTVAPDLADGYKVVVTAQNGTTKTTYTIHFVASQPTVSTAPTVAQISVLNNITGTNDTVTVQGLHGGDIVNVYANSTTQTAIGTETLLLNQTTGTAVTVNIPQLGTTAGTIYVSVTSPGMSESTRTGIAYAAESNDSSLNVVVNNPNGVAGTQVTVTINLQNVAQSIAGTDGLFNSNLKMLYDSNYFEVKTITPGALFSVPADFSAPNKLTLGEIVFLSQDESGGDRLIKNDGVYATVDFIIKPGTPAGNYPITFASSPKKFSAFLTSQNKFTDVIPNITSGQITVNNYVIGDVDGSGAFDVTDYGYLKLFLLGKISTLPSQNSQFAGDVDGSGLIDITDYGYMKLRLLGKITKFPIEP